MLRNAIATLAAITLLSASAALAGNLPRAPAKPSSFAPQAATGAHVYGAPIGTPTVGNSAPRRKHASPKLAAKSTPHRVSRAAPTRAAPKRPAPPAYATPDPG